jgi:hypothetical protein
VSIGETDSDQIVPVLAPDLVRLDLGPEAVVWASHRPEPVCLDPVAAVMLGVIDGQASVAQLVEEVHDEVGVDLDVARAQVERVVALLDWGGLLTSSRSSEPADEAIAARQLHMHPVTHCSDLGSRAKGMHSVNVRFGDRGVRIACGSRRGARVIRRAVAEHLVDEEQPLGFALHKPHGRMREYQLTDRAGVLLATSRSLREILGALSGHLAAFLPAPPGAVRLRVGVLASREGYVACLPPLLFLPHQPRRQLAEHGHAVVDRLGLDLYATGEAAVAPVPWGQLPHDLPDGHARDAPRGRLAAVALPSRGPVTPGQVIAALASQALSGTRLQVLETVREAVSQAWIVTVPITQPLDLPVALATHLNAERGDASA